MTEEEAKEALSLLGEALNMVFKAAEESILLSYDATPIAGSWADRTTKFLDKVYGGEECSKG